MKTHRIGRVFVAFALCATAWHLVGCDAPKDTQIALSILEQGNARGHLVITTDAAVSLGLTQEFFLGAKGTRMTFDGNIDFGGADFGVTPVGGGAKDRSGGD